MHALPCAHMPCACAMCMHHVHAPCAWMHSVQLRACGTGIEAAHARAHAHVHMHIHYTYIVVQVSSWPTSSCPRADACTRRLPAPVATRRPPAPRTVAAATWALHSAALHRPAPHRPGHPSAALHSAAHLHSAQSMFHCTVRLPSHRCRWPPRSAMCLRMSPTSRRCSAGSPGWRRRASSRSDHTCTCMCVYIHVCMCVCAWYCSAGSPGWRGRRVEATRRASASCRLGLQ